MDNLTNKYFFYGLPNDPTLPLYGLYEIITNRFFLVHYNLETLKELCLLWSSRYCLRVVQIDTALNYAPGLIDNSVCMNWTMDNHRDIKMTQMFNPKPTIIATCKSLVEINYKLPWNFKQDQEYLMFACHLLEFQCTVLQKRHQDTLEKYRIYFIDSVPDDPMTDSIPKILEKIKSIIYNEFDFNTASQSIQNLLDKTKHV